MWYTISPAAAGLHWRDQTETGDQTEGTLRCLLEKNDREVSCVGAYVGEPPPHQLGEGIMLDLEVLHLQMTPAEERFNWDRGRVAGPHDEETGREEQSSLTMTPNDISSVVYSYKS